MTHVVPLRLAACGGDLRFRRLATKKIAARRAIRRPNLAVGLSGRVGVHTLGSGSVGVTSKIPVCTCSLESAIAVSVAAVPAPCLCQSTPAGGRRSMGSVG